MYLYFVWKRDQWPQAITFQRILNSTTGQLATTGVIETLLAYFLEFIDKSRPESQTPKQGDWGLSLLCSGHLWPPSQTIDQVDSEIKDIW